MPKPRKQNAIKKPTGGKKAPPPYSRELDKYKGRQLWLHVYPNDIRLPVSKGDTIWNALKAECTDIDSDCGGLGRCGKCKVRVLSSVMPPTPEETELLSKRELNRGVRLGCRTRITGDLSIHIGGRYVISRYYQMQKDGRKPDIRLDPLLVKKQVALRPLQNDKALTDFGRIKKALGKGYRQSQPAVRCLRQLPAMLSRTGDQGTAVLHGKRLLAWQRKDEIDCYYGFVFDVGTTTLVGKLVDLRSGDEVTAVSFINSQIKYGANLINRIEHTRKHPGGLKQLRDLVIRDMNGIIKRLLEVNKLRRRDIFVAVVAGNTTMQHILLNVSPKGIGEAPFSPVVSDGLVFKAADIPLRLHPEALVYVMPVSSGYIGGDLIATILASGAAEQEEKIVLGLDLGTNGEIFLGNRKRMLTCSAAAGPALEGGSISCGMIAKTGAIEAVQFLDERIYYKVIGNTLPHGLCGSGLVDLAAVLAHYGVVDREGAIQPGECHAGGPVRFPVVRRNGVYDFRIQAGKGRAGPLYLTQRDVRELQLTKGAIAAGIQILMDEMGIGVNDIGQVCLAGALGNYVSPLSSMRIGLIPEIDPGKITLLGNAASMGATMVLLSKHYWEMATSLARSIEHIELSNRRDFNAVFLERLDFPEKNLWRPDPKA